MSVCAICNNNNTSLCCPYCTVRICEQCATNMDNNDDYSWLENHWFEGSNYITHPFPMGDGEVHIRANNDYPAGQWWRDIWNQITNGLVDCESRKTKKQSSAYILRRRS